MIPALILWLIKKYVRPYLQQRRKSAGDNTPEPATGKAFLLSILITISSVTTAQEQTREYIVSYKGDQVGLMKLYQKKTSNSTYVKIISAVQMRFVFNVKVLTDEESVFKNGKLVYSKLSRNVNGKEKANKQTRVAGDVYQTSSDGKSNDPQTIAIGYNLHLMYSSEPENVRQVYSDNFLQFLPIEKAGDHRYKIILPDGSYNYYLFENGICSKVEVHHSLYSIELKLKQ